MDYKIKETQVLCKLPHQIEIAIQLIFQLWIYLLRKSPAKILPLILQLLILHSAIIPTTITIMLTIYTTFTVKPTIIYRIISIIVKQSIRFYDHKLNNSSNSSNSLELNKVMQVKKWKIHLTHVSFKVVKITSSIKMH